MEFHIEMSRSCGDGDGTTLVTLWDGVRPKLGGILQDSVGALWRVLEYRRSEVRIQPLAIGQDPPKTLMAFAPAKGVQAA